MQVNKVQGSNNLSFKKLYIAENLAKKIADKRTTQKFLSEFADIKKIIENNKLDKKRYTDIILHQEKGTILAKIVGATRLDNCAHMHVIENTPKGARKFKNWVNKWNHACNPNNKNRVTDYLDLIRNGEDNYFFVVSPNLKNELFDLETSPHFVAKYQRAREVITKKGWDKIRNISILMDGSRAKGFEMQARYTGNPAYIFGNVSINPDSKADIKKCAKAMKEFEVKAKAWAKHFFQNDK